MIVEKSSGHIGALGESWKAITDAELALQIAKAAKFSNVNESQITDALRNGKEIYTGEYTWKEGNAMAKIRQSR